MREELQASTELRVSNAYTLLCVSHIAIYFVHKGTVHAKAKKNACNIRLARTEALHYAIAIN